MTPSTQCEFIESDINPEYMITGFSDGSLRLFWQGQYQFSTSLNFQNNHDQGTFGQTTQSERQEPLSDLFYATGLERHTQEENDLLQLKESFSSLNKFIFSNNFLISKADQVFLIFIQINKAATRMKSNQISQRKESSVSTSVRHLKLFRHHAHICRFISFSNCRMAF